MILRRLLEPANFSNLGYGVYTSIQNIVQGKTDDNEDPFPVLEAFVDFLLNLPLENQAQCVRYKWNKAISSAHKKALAADKKELVRKIEALMGVWSNLAPPPPVSTPSPDSTKGRSPSPSTSETPSGMSVDENSSEKASGTKRASSPTEGAEEAARKKQDVKEKPVLALSKEPPVRKPVKPRTPSTFPRATAVPDANFLSNLNKNAAGASSKGTFTIRPRAQSSKPAAAPSVPEAKDTPMTPPKSASTSPINTSASAKPKKSVRFKPDHAMVEVRLYHRDPEEWGIPVVFRTPPAVQLPADVVERSRFLTEEAGRRFQSQIRQLSLLRCLTPI
ncbi:hypothetical protein BCR43DRAFT_334960 [Syncephalastrum racemosum]|uniref:Uncharacterized protein n=1 Tax=Syncephalastrum racemosum TaxID=13706 RepID=A0A1X2H8J2_SYNRA|nr:hypothetical protein BCR43DRAFT_334960 [Syncephalastrum racemosum]